MTIRRIKNRPSEMSPVLGRIQNAVVLALITAGIALPSIRSAKGMIVIVPGGP